MNKPDKIKERVDEIRYEIEDFFDNGERRKDIYKYMKIKEAKENIMKNFRANYTNDHMGSHDVEVFLLNAMEQLEQVVRKEIEKKLVCQHNYLIKLENSGWLTRPGGREMKTVYCSKCLHEKNI